MSKQKTFNLSFDGESVFKIKIEGDDKIVQTLADDILFNSMLRDAVRELVEASIAKRVKAQHHE